MGNTLSLEAENCSGCRLCMLICSYEKYHEFNLSRSRIKINNESKGYYHPAVCERCEEFNCGSACPNEAITKDPETGAPIVNMEKCIECELCIEACEHEAITLSNEEILICDLCGGEPMCAKYCSYGCLHAVKAN